MPSYPSPPAEPAEGIPLRWELRRIALGQGLNPRHSPAARYWTQFLSLCQQMRDDSDRGVPFEPLKAPPSITLHPTEIPCLLNRAKLVLQDDEEWDSISFLFPQVVKGGAE